MRRQEYFGTEKGHSKFLRKKQAGPLPRLHPNSVREASSDEMKSLRSQASQLKGLLVDKDLVQYSGQPA